MRAIDVEDFNNKIVNQIYKEMDFMIEKADKENIDDLLILQEKLASLLLILRKENETTDTQGLFGGR